ncbi:hypothetical protein Droror1_Dr00010756 [Drosera rotundifolia]
MPLIGSRITAITRGEALVLVSGSKIAGIGGDSSMPAIVSRFAVTGSETLGFGLGSEMGDSLTPPWRLRLQKQSLKTLLWLIVVIPLRRDRDFLGLPTNGVIPVIAMGIGDHGNNHSNGIFYADNPQAAANEVKVCTVDHRDSAGQQQVCRNVEVVHQQHSTGTVDDKGTSGGGGMLAGAAAAVSETFHSAKEAISRK